MATHHPSSKLGSTGASDTPSHLAGLIFCHFPINRAIMTSWGPGKPLNPPSIHPTERTAALTGPGAPLGCSHPKGQLITYGSSKPSGPTSAGRQGETQGKRSPGLPQRQPRQDWVAESESENRSAVSSSLSHHGLCPWNSAGQHTGVGSLSQPRDRTSSPTLQEDSLPAKPQEKPKNTGVGSLSLLRRIFLTQEPRRGLPHCRHTLCRLSYEGSPHWLPTNTPSSQCCGARVNCAAASTHWRFSRGSNRHVYRPRQNHKTVL